MVFSVNLKAFQTLPTVFMFHKCVLIEKIDIVFYLDGNYTISADTTSTNIANNDILHGALVLYSEE